MEESENRTDEAAASEQPSAPVVAEEKGSSKNAKQDKKQSEKKSVKKGGLKNHWAIKATVITFFLSAFFSLLSELTASAGIIVTTLLLVFLIFCGVLFDGVGVSVAACELAPLMSMASKKVPGAKTAIKLVKNAEVVSNICNDVIGDCCGILSGACASAVVIKLMMILPGTYEKIIAIVMSAVVSALTVGGKAFLKNVAINNAKDFVMFTSKVISVFIKEKR